MKGFQLVFTWSFMIHSWDFWVSGQQHQQQQQQQQQFFDSSNNNNNNKNSNSDSNWGGNSNLSQDPYYTNNNNIFSNNKSIIERAAFQDKYNRQYELQQSNYDPGTGGTYYANSTYRLRTTNVTNIYDDRSDHRDPNSVVYGPEQKSIGLSTDTRRLQNYPTNNRNYGPENHNFYNSYADLPPNSNNNNNRPTDQPSKSYEEAFRDRSYSQYQRERGDFGSGRRSDDYSVTSRSGGGGINNNNFPGAGAGSSYYDRNNNINTNANYNYPRQNDPYGGGGGGGGSSSSGGNPYGAGSGYTRYPDQGSPFGSGQNINPQGTNFNNRGVFDPGYPYKNIWNEHWSTTTDRPTAPGVLGRWRPDLQGHQRPEDLHQIPTPVYVTTAYGRVQGFKVKLYDGPWVPLPARPGIANVDKEKESVSSFVGIPYARPPTPPDGRFRPPRPHTGWQLLQAAEFGPACPQPSRFFGYTAGIVSVDEDCLYLNVFSPDVGSGAKGSPYPVIFYIHDGDFIHGASNQFPPHQLVAWYDCVVVTVNFRLGAIGFLSTADEYSPGNYGMLDLSLALKWVHTNIRSFNGDPDRITLVGLGSGAAAAGLLMLSPRSRGYVKNVVALEGAPTADWAAIIDKYRLQNTTELFSMKLGCWQQYEQTSWKMIQCLRSRSWQELANLELEPDVGTFPWSPAVDKEFRVPKDDYINDWKEEDWKFLPDDPIDLLKHGEYPYVKYMTGFSRQSAADLLYANKTLAPNYVVTREWFDEQIHRWVKKYNYTLNPEGVYSAIRYAYTYWPDPQNTTHLREEYINFLSDALYRSPVDQTVKLLLARGIQVHSYLLNYTLEGLRLPFWREVPRGMEYYLLSGAPFMDPEFYPERLRVDRSAWTEGDRNMSNFFMTAVANMAHFGHPTPHEVLGLYWERATGADLKYLSLNATNNSTMQRNYHQRELTFWSEYMPSVVGRYVPTYAPTTEYWWEPNEPLQIAFWTVSGVCLILIVILVACFLLWRTAKKQRDRIYDDLGLVNGPPIGIGTIVGDEISEYAETVKTADSMDSGVKLTHHHPPQSHHPNPSSQNSTNVALRQMYPSPPLEIHHPPSGHRERDRFPTPKRNVRDRERDSPQTQV